MDAHVLWLILGITLIIIEMVTGSFYLFVLGLACFAAGAAAFLGQPFPVQSVVVVLIASVGSYFVHVYRARNAALQMKSLDAGQPARFEGWTDAGTRRARVRYRDASWDARVETGADPEPGATVYVISADGNVLHVSPRAPD